MQVDWTTLNKYEVIYADPPWAYQTWSDKGKGKSPDNHYSCMTMEDIWNISIPAAKDCLLFLWVTDPMLLDQLECMKRWGFQYKTVGFTWVKLNKLKPTPYMGCGYYTRSNPEMCLIGRKGNPPRPARRDIRQVVQSPIREHSRKPDSIRDSIASMYPTCTKLELFGRQEFEGWDVIGNQVGKFTEATVYD